MNNFWFPGRLQELLQAPFSFLRSFCCARIRLDPSGGQVLHHDCISMIVSRFTTFTENFVICCDQITKIFCTKYGSANASSARSSRNFGLVTDLAISVLRGNECKHCAYPNPHFSWMWALKILHEKNWRENLCVQELCHPPKFSLNSCSRSGMSEHNGAGLAANNGSPRSIVVSSLFGFGSLVGLVNSCSSEISEEHGSLRSCLSTCLLDTAAGQ